MGTPHEVTAMAVETIAMSAVEVVEDTVIATTETLAALAMLLQQPPMVIQLLVQRLGNLMVAATLMRNTPVEISDC
jgi:hypothetical protein